MTQEKINSFIDSLLMTHSKIHTREQDKGGDVKIIPRLKFSEYLLIQCNKTLKIWDPFGIFRNIMDPSPRIFVKHAPSPLNYRRQPGEDGNDLTNSKVILIRLNDEL